MFGGGYTRAEDVGDNPQYKFTKYAAGLAAGVYGAKKLGINLLNTKTGRYAQNALAGALTSLAGHTVPKLYGKHDAWDILSASGSNSMRMAARGYEEITTQMTTAYNHAQRESVLFNYLGSFTKTGKITEDASTRNQITSLFKEYTRAKSSDKATNAVTSDVVARAMSIIGKENLHPNLTQHDLLTQLHEKIRTHHPTAEKRTILKNIFGNVHNQREFRDVFTKTIDSENKAFTNKITTMFGRGARGITIGDLEDSATNPLDPQIEKYFRKLGINKTQLANVYGTNIKKFQGQAMLVGQKNPHVTRDLWQSFKGAQTGLVLTNKGVVPLSMMEGEAKKGIFNTLNRLQIPLLPGVMNVPLSILNFNKYDEKVSLGLGRIGKQRDLLNIKSALRSEKKSFGITFGKNLLTYDVNNGSLTAHTDLNLDVIGLQGNSKGRGLVEARGARETPFKDKASFLKYLKGGDPDRTSGLYGFANDGNKLFGLIEKNPEKFFDVTYHPDSGFDLIPKNDKASLIFNYLRSQGDYKYKAINPKQLLNFLANNANDLDKIQPEHLAEALDHVLHSSVDIGESVHDYLKKTKGGPGESNLTRKAMELLDLANTDPTEAYAYAKRNSDQFLKEGSTDLYRAAQRIISNPYDLTEAAGYGKEGALDKLKSGFLGSSGKSPLQLELEKAVLKERLRDAGEAAFFAKTGLDRAAVENLATTHVAHRNGSLPRDKLIEAYEKHLGVTSAIEAVKLSASILSTSSGVQGINESTFRQFTTAFIDAEKLVTGKSVDARVLKYALEESSSVSNNSVFTEAQSLKYFGAIMHNPTGDAKSVFSRIDGSKFEPYFLKSDQFGDVGNYAINGNVGIGDSLTGFLDQTTPLNGLTYKATVMARAANNVLGEVGLGVGNGSMSTVGNAIAAYGITRVLPMVAAFYAWGMVNNTLDSVGLPTIPAIAANVLGLGGRVKARVQDVTGLTGLFKNAVNSIPGLDQYFTPKDSQEYDDHLAFGDDEIRYRRNWILGNRSPATGTSVEFYRPSFYRRWRSNWTNAKNVKAFNPFIDWVKEVEDRPYSTDSKGYNPQGGQLGGGGGLGQGSGGGSGSGEGIGGTGFGPGGMGDGITGAGDGGHGLVLGESKGELTGPGDAISPLSITNKFKSISGFYGAFLRYNPAFASEEIKLQVQDPGFATSMGRLMYANRTGEFTGPLGEFLRRFVGGRNQAEDAINPLPNTMPDFLGKKFHTGDPYCVSPETYIVTENGLTQAQNIGVGQKVLTHEGNYESVYQIFKRPLKKDEVAKEIKVFGMPHLTLKASPGHPVYTKRGEGLEWVEVKDLVVGDYVAYPLPKQTQEEIVDLHTYLPTRVYNESKCLHKEPGTASINYYSLLSLVINGKDLSEYQGKNNSRTTRDIKRAKSNIEKYSFSRFVGWTPDLCYVLGWATAEASYSETQTTFSMNVSEEPQATELIEILTKYFPLASFDWGRCGDTEGATLNVYSKLVSNLLSHHTGKGAHSKFLSREIMGLSSDCAKAFLKGYFMGDGCSFISKGRRVASAKTCNLKLAYQIWELLLKQGFVSSIIENKPRQASYKGKTINSKVSYTIKLGSEHAQRFMVEVLGLTPPDCRPNPYSNYKIEGDYILFKVKEINKVPEIKEVYGFSVENDASFCVAGIATHNTRVAGIGELVLPGDSFERSHPEAMLNTALTGKARYDSYDTLTKMEILAQVDPQSFNYRQQRKNVEGLNLSPQGFRRYQEAVQQASDKGELYRLYSRKNVETETHRATVQDIGVDGEVYTDQGAFSLAGVKFSYNAYQEGYSNTLAKFGIGIGQTVSIKTVAGSSNLFGETVIPGVINGANIEIMNSKYGSYDPNDKSPLAYQEQYGHSALEGLLHSDNLFSNKLMRVRSALEQFERGEVYGTDNFDWLHPISSGLKPTITSYVNRDPLGAAVGAAITASLFVKSTSDKIAVAKYAGGAMALLSVLHKIIGSPKPDQYMHDADVDEYVDTLKYTKYSRIQKEADRRIMGHEGSSEELSVLQQLKTYAEKQVKRTMIGYDQENGTLEEALATLPRRQRQIAKEILLYGSNNEKEDFYDLLPRAQKAVLGDFLGMNAPQKRSLEELGDKFNIPDKDWTGWSALVSDRHVETLIRQNEGVQAGRPGRSTLDKAKQILGADFQVPIMDAGHGSITAILNSTPNIQYDVERIRAPRSSLTLHFNTNEDVAQAYRDRAIDEVSGAR